MWKLCPFLLEYWKKKFTIFKFDDVAGLQAEIFAGPIDPNKKKRILFFNEQVGYFLFSVIFKQRTILTQNIVLKKDLLNC